MENASKALLMAAGVLLTMMMVALIVFARGRLGEYYASEQKLADIDNLAEFNAQFTSFDRNNVYGYEIISLTNKVADYNKRYSKEGKNNENYNPIEVIVSFEGKVDAVKSKIWYSLSKGYIFNVNSKKKWVQNSVKNDLVDVIGKAIGISEFYGSEDKALKLAKSIKTILAADDNGEVEYYMNTKKVTKDIAIEQLKIIGLNTYNQITGEKETDYAKMKKNLEEKESVFAFYEYNQFKKAKFNCQSIGYDVGNTGRVSQIVFNFTGEVE